MKKKTTKRIFLAIGVILWGAAVFYLQASQYKSAHILAGVAAAGLAFILFFMVIWRKHLQYIQAVEAGKSVLDSVAEAVVGVDRDGCCTFINKSGLEILGYDGDEALVGKNLHEQIHHTKLDGSFYPKEECPIMEVLVRGEGVHATDEVFWKADNTPFFVEYRANPQFQGGRITGAVVTFLDVTKRKESDEKIQYLTYHDSATGLYNYAYVQEQMEALDVAARLPISVIIGDVNGLKLTNDVFGHDAGDKLLQNIGWAIQKSCRTQDVVARIGGDEFLILLPNTTKEDAGRVRLRIMEEVGKITIGAVKGSIALGFSTKENPWERLEDTIKQAEEYMYKNKSLHESEISMEQLEHITDVLHQRSPRETKHAENVQQICEAVALALGLSDEEVRKIRDAGYYHDIGKIALDDDVLKNQGEFSDAQRLEMQRHPLLGYRILDLFPETVDLAGGALEHHERWDGSGYPKGLKGTEISLMGRIIAVAEAFDAMTNFHASGRRSRTDALKFMEESKGTLFDPDVVDAFLQVMEEQQTEIGA